MTWNNLSPGDPSSYCRPDICIIQHINLKLRVSFEKKTLSGTAELYVKFIKCHNQVVLDSSDLNIESVTLGCGTTLSYGIDGNVKDIGSKLTINLPHETTEGELVTLLIKYETSPSARALQWMDGEKTSSSNIHPYLFSQCQPINARTIVPCQDSPSVKFTYNASITAPKDLAVVMSALLNDTVNCEDEPDFSTHTFKQPVLTPSYLIALAIGDLKSAALGVRSKVWAKPDILDDCQNEFRFTNDMLVAAENLCGPYVWGIYDLLVLPPSFPFGGMENPCLTFVTPTLIAGDRSLTSVIIHEIMHSWTGNLITNRNFEHFWLNEGFTVFLERKVYASMLSDKEEAKKMRDFLSLLGLQELKETINGHLGPENPLTKLVVNLSSVHPDDAFSIVPYEKGSLFLRYLEDLVGGPSVFDEFLRSYFTEFKEKSIDTNDFKSYFINYFNKKGIEVQNVDWDKWLYSPGMPPIIPKFDTTKADECLNLAELWKVESISVLEKLETKKFNVKQIIHFLQILLDQAPLAHNKLKLLPTIFGIYQTKNSEILFRWLRLGIRAKYEPIIPEVIMFVNSMGRMKFVRPLYRDMYAWEHSRLIAIDNFKENEKNMMHVTIYTIKKDLHLD